MSDFPGLTAWVAIAANPIEPVLAFYQALFACPPQIYRPPDYAELELPGLRLAIFRPQATHAPEFAAPSSGPLSLVITVPDLDLAIAQCTALGCSPPGDIVRATHGREIYAYDPLGNRLILYEPAVTVA